MGSTTDTYRQVAGDDESVGDDAVLQAIYDFGSYNIYTAFDPRATLVEYSKMKHLLTEAGLSVPNPPELLTW